MTADDMPLATADGLWSLWQVAGVTAADAVTIARTWPTLHDLQSATADDVARQVGQRAATALARIDHRVPIRTCPTVDGGTVLTPFDPAWPSLDRCPSPPAILWAAGNVDLLATTPGVTIVGTRQPTRFGLRVAAAAAEAAVAAGAVTVSGAALGIDSAAATATWQADGTHIAILGHGLGHPGRGDQAVLARPVGPDALLLTEQPPGTVATAQTLVARNRLQVAFGHVVVVAQAAVRSGTAHTVRFAIDADVPVIVPVPAGTHAQEPASGLLVALANPDVDLARTLAATGRLRDRLAHGPAPTIVTVADGTALAAAITDHLPDTTPS